MLAHLAVIRDRRLYREIVRVERIDGDHIAGAVRVVPGAYPPRVSAADGTNLLTTDEAMWMKGARKDARGLITEAGSMIVYVAGYPAIMGLQPLYFRDPELARRARLTAEPAQTKKTRTLAVASG